MCVSIRRRHEYDWFGHNLVSPSDVPALRERWKAFEDIAAGGAGDALTREAMDAEQRFAYDIHEYKIQERARLAAAGDLRAYRALRMIMAGTAGTGKSRTVRGIAGLRQREARAAYERAGRAVDAEVVENAAVLVAPTGTASFQMKFGATTAHRAFGLGRSSYCGPQPNRDDPVFLKKLRRLRSATVVVMDEFSMIGRQMMGKICFKANDMLRRDHAEAGQLTSMGGKDVMLSGDPDQAKPICDESGHKEGAYKGEGGNKPRDAQGRAKEKPAGALDLSELVGLGVAFRKEFDDAVLLSQRHRLTDPTKADVADEDREAFIADAERFREVTDRMSDLSWTEDDYKWLAQRNRSEMARRPGGQEEVEKFLGAQIGRAHV